MKTHYALHCRRRLASIAVFCCAGTPWSVSAQVSINVIALTGESTPITDTTYEVFDFPRINDAGKISFTALLTGPSVTEVNDHALFEVSNAAISPFQQTGSTLPTITPALVDSVGFPSLTNAGRFALLAGLYDDTAGERIGQALLSETPSGLSLIAREDTTILPGYAEPILALPVPNMNRAGHIAFRASVEDPAIQPVPSGSGIWTNRTGSLQLIAKHGDVALGVPAGYVIDHVDIPAQNHLSQIVFRASVNDPNTAPDDYRHAIYRDMGSGLELVTWAAPSGPNIDRVSTEPQIDRNGNVLFWHHDRAADPMTDTAIRKFTGPGNITDIVREGDPAPGTSGVFADIRPAFSMNNFGDVVFVGNIVETPAHPETDSGVWKYSNGALELILRENDPVPALGPDVFINSIGNAVVNHTGRVAVVTTLRGAGVERANATALLAQDVAGTFHPVVRTGDSIDVSGSGDLRTVRSFEFDHLSTTTGHGQFSALGSIAMILHFETLNAQQELEYADAMIVTDVGCPADFTGDGLLNIFDYIAFGNAYAAGSPSADLTADNTLNIFDYIAFGTLFAQGCP